MEQEHKRRVRYKGTHPRAFREKYKELDPEKYGADVEKIIQSGKTPAGMHIPIMVNEILEVLDIQPGQVGYDATLGYGGHTGKAGGSGPSLRYRCGPHRVRKDPGTAGGRGLWARHPHHPADELRPGGPGGAG